MEKSVGSASPTSIKEQMGGMGSGFGRGLEMNASEPSYLVRSPSQRGGSTLTRSGSFFGRAPTQSDSAYATNKRRTVSLAPGGAARMRAGTEGATSLESGFRRLFRWGETDASYEMRQRLARDRAALQVEIGATKHSLQAHVMQKAALVEEASDQQDQLASWGLHR